MRKFNFKKIVVIVLITSLFASCTAYKYTTISKEKEYEDMFVGKSHNHIVTSIGAPNRELSDGAEGSILIYEEITTYSKSRSNTNNSNGLKTNTVTQQSSEYIQFFINADGVCYDVKTNHTETIKEIDKSESTYLTIVSLFATIAGVVLCAVVAAAS
jgi:hypothetical protein